MIHLDWIFCFGENCFFSNKIFHIKYSIRLEVFVYRVVTGEGDSQMQCLCMFLPALRTAWCLHSLQTQPQEWLSHIAVMATKSKLFHKEMVSGRWQLNYITYAHMVPHHSVLWARNSRCGSDRAFWRTHHAHGTFHPPPLRPGATTKRVTLNVTFLSAELVDVA